MCLSQALRGVPKPKDKTIIEYCHESAAEADLE